MAAARKPRTLSHFTPNGEARMVDVSGKPVTTREACASGVIHMRAEVLDALLANDLAKGDGLGAARIAGILAAKRTGEWIPLCHPLPLECVQFDFARSGQDELTIRCTTKTSAKTGVEMEALVGVSAAALTLYDMAKSADKSMVIGPIQLEHKTGGKSGTYRRKRQNAETSKRQNKSVQRP